MHITSSVAGAGPWGESIVFSEGAADIKYKKHISKYWAGLILDAVPHYDGEAPFSQYNINTLLNWSFTS